MILSSRFKDYLHLHFLVFLWGFTSIVGKLMAIDAFDLVAWRTFITFVTLGFWLRYKGVSLVLSRKYLYILLATGLLTALHWATFFGAARIANVSISLAGMSTTAFWTSIFAPIFLRKKFQAYETLLGLLVVVGLYLIFASELRYSNGLYVSITSAVFVAGFSLVNSEMARKVNPFVITFYEMIGAFATCLLLIPVYRSIFKVEFPVCFLPNLQTLAGILFLAVVCTVYAYSASTEIMRRLSAFAVNLTVNLEPVYGIILALLIFGESEKMTLGFYLGAVVILVSVFLHPFMPALLKRKD